MTFLSTTPPLEHAIASHGLVELLSEAQPGNEVRHLYVMPAVKAFVEHEHADFRKVQFDKLKDFFVLNYVVTASVRGKSAPKIQFERLKGCDEVWVACLRRPRDLQWRFFGRFVARGVFVIFFKRTRAACGNDKEYGEQIAQFLGEWLAVFGTNDCFRGETPEDYFGERVIDGDE